jgi:heat-inducible transcriptional repressor
MITELNTRSREILRLVVESFVETGGPVGSRQLAKRLSDQLSPASVRNVLADLEDMGLLYAPHTSAGRMPTEAGLRLFVDGLLQLGPLSQEERARIEEGCAASGRSVGQLLEEAGQVMSGLSRYAGLVMAPKMDSRLKHIEFVSLGPGRALVVMVTEDGLVENRVIALPEGLLPASLTEATNYLTARLVGRTLGEARAALDADIAQTRREIEALTAKVVEAGYATWVDVASGDGVLIVKGQANLLNDVEAVGDLERIRALFTALERKEGLMRLLEATDRGEGTQIFIGAHSELFSLSGCSLIIAPFSNREDNIVGAIGVIGPTRMNYARIIPMVDYTAKVVGRLLG